MPIFHRTFQGPLAPLYSLFTLYIKICSLILYRSQTSQFSKNQREKKKSESGVEEKKRGKEFWP